VYLLNLRLQLLDLGPSPHQDSGSLACTILDFPKISKCLIKVENDSGWIFFLLDQKDFRRRPPRASLSALSSPLCLLLCAKRIFMTSVFLTIVFMMFLESGTRGG
jgi:hypothetical protein